MWKRLRDSTATLKSLWRDSPTDWAVRRGYYSDDHRFYLRWIDNGTKPVRAGGCIDISCSVELNKALVDIAQSAGIVPTRTEKAADYYDQSYCG